MKRFIAIAALCALMAACKTSDDTAADTDDLAPPTAGTLETALQPPTDGKIPSDLMPPV